MDFPGERVHGCHYFLKRVCDSQRLRILGLVDLQILRTQLTAILRFCASRNVIHCVVQQVFADCLLHTRSFDRMQGCKSK